LGTFETGNGFFVPNGRVEIFILPVSIFIEVYYSRSVPIPFGTVSTHTI
jgi:hypothetical protein